MKVAMLGSISIDEEAFVFPLMSSFIEEFTHGNVCILTGDMQGVEKLASRFATFRGLDCVVFRPPKPVEKSVKEMWKSVAQRNRQIVDNATKVLAIWDGVSPDTLQAINYARSREVPVMVLTL